MSSSSDGQEVELDKLFRRYAESSLSTSPFDAKQMPRLCEIGKAYLQRKAKELVANAVQAPVLSHYSADGTPLSTKRKVNAKIKDGLTVKRYGKETEEFLVQHGYIRTLDVFGHASTVAILRDPLPLTNGKGALATFSAFKSFFQTPRQLGHRGICIAHYAFDRALLSSVGRLLKQYHKLLAPQFAAPQLGKDSGALELLEWVVITGCALHDAHNGLKWAMHGHFQDTDLLSDVYIVVASVRNSYGLLCDHLGRWLHERVMFVPDDQLPPMQGRYELWTALGAEPELAETLAFELRLQWHDGRLEVAASCASLEDLMEKLSGTLLALWAFRQFTTSRWATIGASCRGVAAAILSGFDDLVKVVRKDPRASDYHISGYSKLTTKAKQFVFTAALVAYVCDGFLVELMSDNRLPLRAQELEDCMAQEIEFLAGINQCVWAWLGEACDLPAVTLRSDVLAAGQVSIGFITTKALGEARKLPWSLGCGDVDRNLDGLLAGATPAEPIAAKIKRLLELGYSRSQIKQALALLMDCPWGTQSVEQGHASATLLKRAHPDFGKETLVLRAFFHSFRRLLPSSSTEGRKATRPQRDVERLLAKSPHKVLGRHLYFKDLMALAGKWKGDPKKSVPSGVHKTIMKKHGGSWARLSPDVQKKYEARAALTRSSQDHALQEALVVQAQQMALARSRQSACQDQGTPLALGHCKLTQQDFANMQEMARTARFTDKLVSNLRQCAQEAPELPTAEMTQALRSIQVDEDRDLARWPEWLPTLCWHRSFFQDKAFVVQNEEGQRQYFKVLHATQTPYFACFSLLEEVEQDIPVVPVTKATWDELGRTRSLFKFKAKFLSVVPWRDLPEAPLASMHVLMGLQYSEGHHLVSDAELVPLKDVMSWLPKAERKERKPQANAEEASASRPDPALLAQHPYLKGVLSQQAGGSSSQEGSAGPVDTGPALGEALDDEAVQELFSQLENKRHEHVDPPGYHGDFVVTLLGGKWAMESKGVAFVAFQGSVKGNTLSEGWCNQYSLQRTARFEISKYGEQVASRLAHGWCDRMLYFFRLWEGSGQAKYRYTAEDAAAYEEPPEVAELATILTGAALARLNKVRALTPM